MVTKASCFTHIIFACFLLMTSATPSSLQPATTHSTNQVVLSPCVLTKKLSSELWQELKIDDYIKNYPNAQNISIQEFARQNGASNFLCGMGQKCNVGELCYPVQGLAWFTLFAVQEFNLFINSMYQAIGVTMDLIRYATASLVMDLVKPPPKKSHKKQIAVDTFAFLNIITWSLVAGVSLACLATSSAWVALATVSTFIGFIAIAGLTSLTIDSMIKRATATQPETVFDYWSQFAFYFSRLQSSMQQGLSDNLRQILDSGLADPRPTSLAHILSNGTFIQPHQNPSLPEMEASLKGVTQIRALVILLRSMNAFIMRGSEPCRGRGLNGAREGTNFLSFCSADGVMMNVVTAHGDKVDDEIYNAKSIGVKYRITAEYLTTKSWECQTKHGMEADPYQHAPLPLDPNAECLVNLPVCDCMRKDISDEIQRSNIVNACRQVGKLKI